MGSFMNEFAVNLLPTLALFALMALPIFSHFYNQLMDRLSNRSEHTSLYVAIGVFVTLGVGALFSWKASVLYLVLFALSGLPMIFGEFKRTERKHKQDSKPAPRHRRLPYTANGLIADAYDSARELQKFLKLAIKNNGGNIETALQISAASVELTDIITKLLELKQIQNVE